MCLSLLYRIVRSAKARPEPMPHPIAPAAASHEPTTARTATPPPQKLTVSVVPAHGSAKCCHSETELRSRRQDISLSPLSKILKQPQRRNPSSTPIICSRRQRDRDFSSRILHDRLAVNQLPTTSAIDRLLSYPESYQFCWLCRRGNSRRQKLFA